MNSPIELLSTVGLGKWRPGRWCLANCGAVAGESERLVTVAKVVVSEEQGGRGEGTFYRGRGEGGARLGGKPAMPPNCRRWLRSPPA